MLPVLNQSIQTAPQELAGVMPNAKPVLEPEQDLNRALQQVRSLLR